MLRERECVYNWTNHISYIAVKVEHLHACIGCLAKVKYICLLKIAQAFHSMAKETKVLRSYDFHVFEKGKDTTVSLIEVVPHYVNSWNKPRASWS